MQSFNSSIDNKFFPVLVITLFIFSIRYLACSPNFKSYIMLSSSDVSSILLSVVGFYSNNGSVFLSR